MSVENVPRQWGVAAELESASDLVAAVRAARAHGYRRLRAYTPHPVEEVWEALEEPPSRLPLLVLAGGIAGAVGGFGLQWWASARAYPLNVGGRPLLSWPAFIPVTFECAVLVAGLAAVLGMFALNRLPRPHHPIFDLPGFERASRDRYFLVVRADDPLFDATEAEVFLRQHSTEVHGVEA